MVLLNFLVQKGLIFEMPLYDAIVICVITICVTIMVVTMLYFVHKENMRDIKSMYYEPTYSSTKWEWKYDVKDGGKAQNVAKGDEMRKEEHSNQ